MTETWRVARSLIRLYDQLNLAYPGRSKVSDGTIGDAAHQTRDSDHNPWYGAPNDPTVTARDFTNDPAVGFVSHDQARYLASKRDPRIKYIISDGQIWEPSTGWIEYNGENGHYHHFHLSVVASPQCDNTAAWDILLPPKPSKEITVDNILAQFIEKQDRRSLYIQEMNEWAMKAITDIAQKTGVTLSAPPKYDRDGNYPAKY